MSKLLEQLELISQNQDWSTMTHHLYQLLEHRDELTEDDLEYTAQLALVILAEGDFQERWDITKVFLKLKTRVVKPLQLIWEDNEEEIEKRWFAGKILGNFKQPEVIISLVKVFSETKIEDLQEIAALSLSQIDRDAIEPLVELLNKPELRILAAKSLAQIRRPEVIEPLLPLVKDRDSTVRKIAVETLSSFHDSRIPPLLIEALGDLKADVRREAVIGLGSRSDLAVELNLCNHLAPLLQDLSLDVCQQTAIALSKLKQEESAQILFETLKASHTPIPLQVTLIQALAWLETSISLEYLFQSLYIVSETSVIEIIRVFGRIENQQLQIQVGSYLIDFFFSGHPLLQVPLVKQNLVYTWGKLRTISAQPILEKLATDSNQVVKLHALNALANLHN